MELINLKCANCEAFFGNIENSWNRIGKNYLTPTAQPEALKDFWIKATGVARYGEDGTIIEGW